MTDSPSSAVHVWLVMNKALRAIAKHAFTQLQKGCLGDSDFRVLEVLLHKGPLSVNAIGPKVNLNPGSISVAVDRLYARGLVSRVESSEDRRIRIVALTPCGEKLISHVFEEHAAVLERVFANLTPDELKEFEATLKKVGRRAEQLGISDGLKANSDASPGVENRNAAEDGDLPPRS